MTHHHHIVTYYKYRAKLAREGGAFGMFTDAYCYGRAFLYTDFA